jgi:ribonuclease HI
MPKINIDASLSKTSAKGVTAAFCCNSNGVYLAASAVVFNGITDSTVLEALACREALALADDLVLNQFQVASDCKQVVTDVKEGSLGKYGVVITKINARTTQFIQCSFAYEGRAHNFEAHNLARHALTLDAGRHLWLDTPYSINIPVNIVINE